MRGATLIVTDHAFPDLGHEEAMARAAGAAFRALALTTEEETAAATRGADVLLVNFAPITRRVLEGLAEGATVIRYGVGYDNVDADAAAELGVRVCNVPDYGTGTVADHAAALLLAQLRHLVAYDRAIRERGWLKPADVGPALALHTVTIGLVGTGRIGLALADRLRPFGPRLLAHDPYADADVLAGHGVEAVALDALLAAADAISLHAPDTPETHHIIDAGALRQLKRGAVIVNTARGGLIDTDALVAALADGRVGGAGLDTFEDEPLAADSPLREFANVILTPHAAFFSDASVDDLQRLAAEEAARALRGEPLRSRVDRGT
jgi:D-3-phosphoglycerate dehydrogenase